MAVEAARGILPWWVSWGSVVAVVFASFTMAGLGGWAATRIALWKASAMRDQPWTERARFAFAARRASLVGYGAVALVACLTATLYGGPLSVCSHVTLAMVALAVALGTGVSWTRVVSQAVRDRPRSLRQSLGDWAVIGVFYLSPIAVTLAFGAWAPRAFGVRALLATALAALSIAILLFGGALALARLLGLARPANVRLVRIAASACERAGVPLRSVYELRWTTANAFAMPLVGAMAFTTGAVEQMSDEELEAIALHEAGHLGESRGEVAGRVARALAVSLIVLIGPLMHSFEALGAVFALLLFLSLGVAAGRASRRLEESADGVAAAADAPLYARALAKLYEVNLMPAVGRRATTHPFLYDRLLAAGVQPEFPRPEQPSMARVQCALGASVLAAVLIAVAVPLALNEVARSLDEDAYLDVLLLFDSPHPERKLAGLAGARLMRGAPSEAMTLYRAAAVLSHDASVSREYERTAAALATSPRLPLREASYIEPPL